MISRQSTCLKISSEREIQGLNLIASIAGSYNCGATQKGGGPFPPPKKKRKKNHFIVYILLTFKKKIACKN